jgi:hypothetical protein
MRVADLRFDRNNGRVSPDWQISQAVGRPAQEPAYAVMRRHNSPDTYDLVALDHNGRYDRDVMNSLDRFELACAIAEMWEVTEPVTA